MANQLVDWEQKKAFLKYAFNSNWVIGLDTQRAIKFNQDELAAGKTKALKERVSAKTPSEEDIHACALAIAQDAVNKWESGTKPTKNMGISEAAATVLFGDASEDQVEIQALDRKFKCSTFKEFCDSLISLSHRKHCQVMLGLTIRHFQLHFPVNSKHLGTPLLSEISDGYKINHEAYYLNTESPSSWCQLIDRGEYEMHDQCVESLKRFTKQKPFLKDIDGILRCVVLTGGGSPKKDIALLKAIPSKADYICTDISPYMLGVTAKQIVNSRLDEERKNRITYLCEDLFKLRKDDLGNRVRTLWCMLGGTLGNLMEKQFFKQLNQLSQKDDFAVIGIDTIEANTPRDVLQASIMTNYNGKDLREFIIGPVTAALNELRISNSAYELLSNAEPRMLEGRKADFCDVDGSLTYTMAVSLSGGQALFPFVSSRYEAAAFTKFCGNMGWEVISIYKVLATDRFAQFFLKRVNP
jgi:hypothetical protein